MNVSPYHPSAAAYLQPVVYLCCGCSQRARSFYHAGLWLDVPETWARQARALGLSTDGLCPACFAAHRERHARHAIAPIAPIAPPKD